MKQLRRNRARQLLQRLGLFVGVPTLLATLYFGLIASPRYESVAPITVQSAENQASFGLESLIGAVPGSGTSRDALTIREYVLSRAMLERLNAQEQFIAHYQDEAADFWSRLSSDATAEEAYAYYQDKVRLEYDTMSGVLNLSVQAFKAEDAQRFAHRIIRLSEEKVNDLTERAQADSVRYAQKQLSKAETRLTSSRKALRALQTQGADLNPVASATAALSLRGELQAELARARTELRQAQAFMQPNTAKVVALRQRVQALSQQVEQENQRMVGAVGHDGSGSAASAMAEFEPALLEKELSEKAYASSLKALELAHAEAGRQHRYLATIAAPSLPDEPTHPRRLYGVLSVFFISLALFTVGSLLLASLREHARL